jgi:hypothetical protein
MKNKLFIEDIVNEIINNALLFANEPSESGDTIYGGEREFLCHDNSLNNMGLLKNLSPVAINKKIVALSIILSAGTGLAAMPIFNYELNKLDQLNIDIHNSQTAFVISTINTLLLITTTNSVSLYRFITKHNVQQEDFFSNNKNLHILTKIGAILSAIPSLALLWNIELENRELNEQHVPYEFDKFIAWATFCTIPLLLTKTIGTYASISKMLVNKSNLELDSTIVNRDHLESPYTIGKMITYSVTALSILARSLVFTNLTTDIAKNIGLQDEVAETVGVVLGGILTSISVGAVEHICLDKFFKRINEPILTKEIVIGTISTIEGAWFTMPLVSIGLKYIEKWNIFIKGVLFVPFIISHTVLEATTISDRLQDIFSTRHEDEPLRILGDHLSESEISSDDLA